MLPLVPGRTVNEILQYWASTPEWDTPAFISVTATGERKSCVNRKEVMDYAGRFAYKLSQLGVTNGSIVCISLPNSIERVICDMGIFLSGATSLNGQISHSDGRDFMHAMRTSKAQYVILDLKSKTGPYKILQREGFEIEDECVKCKTFPHLRQIIFCQRNIEEPSQDFLCSLKNPRLSKTFANVQPSDLATIMTTSGSTGYSKLVKLTHANLCHFAVQVKTIEPFKGGEHFINCAPLGWAGGFPQWYLGCGITRYFIDMYDGPPDDIAWTLWQTIVKEKIVYGFLSPMYASEIFRNLSWWSNSEWKPEVICMAGQPIKKAQLDIIGKLCSAVDINYGMTECNLLTTHRITDPSLFVERCAGFPGNGVSLKVVDELRNELPRGAIGEIALQSPSLFLGYLNDDASNKDCFTSDGWFCTDDAGYIDSDGRVFVEGRQSDSIQRGIYILYPNWLEQEIKKLDKVRDVVIVPVPDSILHNEICACILTDSVKDTDSKQKRLESVDTQRPSSSSKIPQIVTNNNIENETQDDQSGKCVNYINEGDLMEIASSSTSTSLQGGNLENIRMVGMQKGLNVEYNLTRPKNEEPVRLNFDSQGTESDDIDTDSGNNSLLKALEIEIRSFCDKNQALAVKDAMRMVPKYYLFCEKFPVTGTGKLSRKELQRQASVALGLL